MKKVILIALVCVMAVAALVGCGGGKSEDSVVGTWKDAAQSGRILEIKADGTYYLTAKDGVEVRVEGDYKIESGNVSFYEGEKKMSEFLIDGNELKDLEDGSVQFVKQ